MLSQASIHLHFANLVSFEVSESYRIAIPSTSEYYYTFRYIDFKITPNHLFSRIEKAPKRCRLGTFVILQFSMRLLYSPLNLISSHVFLMPYIGKRSNDSRPCKVFHDFCPNTLCFKEFMIMLFDIFMVFLQFS